jgi:hypothetical protein
MAKRSGSRGSRSERRAERERAERARQHGLPERAIPPRAAPAEPAATPEASSEASGEAPSRQRGGIPPLVKVLGGALLILLGVYWLSQRRDQALTAPSVPPTAAESAR